MSSETGTYSAFEALLVVDIRVHTKEVERVHLLPAGVAEHRRRRSAGKEIDTGQQ